MSEIPEDVIETPILESPLSKYLREYRLLNSLLISLFAVVLLFALLWNFVVWVAPGGEPGSDFADAGPNNSAPKKHIAHANTWFL